MSTVTVSQNAITVKGYETHSVRDGPPDPENARFRLERSLVRGQDGVGSINHYFLGFGVRLWIESEVWSMQYDPEYPSV